MRLDTYIHFSNGKCEEALNFYVQALGAKLEMLLRYSESPMGSECAPDMGNKIVHGRLSLGDGVLMASDAPAGYFSKMEGFAVHFGVDSPEEAERLFAALSDGAEIKMPMEETFWAKRFGMLTDKFGVPWMVNCQKEG